MSESFWLYDFIDREGITKPDDMRRILASTPERVHEAAEAAMQETLVSLPRGLDSVLAARSIDLSAMNSCSKWGCQSKLLDSLFRSVWHYFDAIVVEGPSGLRISRLMETHKESPEYLAFVLEGHVETLLKVRASGMDGLLLFRQKFVPCPLHWQTHLEETNLGAILNHAGDIINRLATEGKITLEEKASAWTYSFEHPLLGGGPLFGQLISEEGSSDPRLDPNRAVAETVFKHYAGRVVADVQTARAYGIPLGSSFHDHSPGRAIESMALRGVDEYSVAMSLKLPVLEGIPISELMRIRVDESLSFDRFRISLRTAIKERVAAAKDDANPRLIAEQVHRDIIEPTLLDIEARLTVAKKAFERKTALNVAIAGVATAIGLVANIPLLLPAGLAAGLSTVHYAKYVDDIKDIKLSDMYFLWDMQKRDLFR